MAQTPDSNDIPTNTMLLIFAVIVALAFTVFQIRSCSSTPEYVQALQQCNDAIKIPFTVKPEGKDTTNWTVDIDMSPETFSLLKHCYDSVAKKYGVEVPVLEIPEPAT